MTFEYNAYSRGRVIKRMRDKGYTLQKIADEFGLSTSRIQQICNAKYKEEQLARRQEEAKKDLAFQIAQANTRTKIDELRARKDDAAAQAAHQVLWLPDERL